MDRQPPYDAMILDMDGVITDTRELHFKSWKKTFEEFLRREGEVTASFSNEDYQSYVDGMPREDGIKSFLESRSIKVDPVKVHELSTEKNNLFKKLLHNEKSHVFNDSIEAIKHWKKKGIPVAVISSSKNCKLILQEVGIADLFDACVDGLEGDRLNIKGKPAPDFLLEAAKRLNKRPEECAIVEDSLSGITAGKKAHLKEVIGISREGQTPAEKLYAYGADSVVSSLYEMDKLPNALIHWENFKARIGTRDIALFLDFDGTISNIVSDPKKATISTSLKKILEDISKSIKVGLISGRDLGDVKKRVGIENIFYAGCHGLDISGPGCFHFHLDEAQKIIPRIEEATLAVGSALAGIKGVIVERKSHSTAIHYRMVTEITESAIRDKILSIVNGFSQVKVKEGKKVIEIYPGLDWGKGKAIRKICEVLDINPLITVPIFIGDDLTDEDAFNELYHKGIGIKVAETEDGLTMANYWLKNPSEVEKFLILLASTFTGKEKRWRTGL